MANFDTRNQGFRERLLPSGPAFLFALPPDPAARGPSRRVTLPPPSDYAALRAAQEAAGHRADQPEAPREDLTVDSAGARRASRVAGTTPGVARGRLPAENGSPAAGRPRRGRRGHLARKAGAAWASPPFLLPWPRAPPAHARTPTSTHSSQNPGIQKGRSHCPAAPSSHPASIPAPCAHTWRQGSRRPGTPRARRAGAAAPRRALTCWPARGLPWGALLKKEVLAVKKKSSASSSRLL